MDVYLDNSDYIQLRGIAVTIFEKLKNTEKVHVFINDDHQPVSFVIKPQVSIEEIMNMILDANMVRKENRLRSDFSRIAYCSDETWHTVLKHHVKRIV